MTLISEWGLPLKDKLEFVLGDESAVEFNAYGATVIFAEQELSISIIETDSDPPMIGYGLLKGFRIEVDMIDGGKITIKQIEAEV